MINWKNGMSSKLSNLALVLALIMFFAACENEKSSSHQRTKKNGLDAVEHCLAIGIAKQDAIHMLSKCGISGEIAPKPLGEYRPATDAGRNDFAKADSVRIQGQYHQEHGSHAMVSVNFNETGILDIEVNAAAKEDQLQKPFAEVNSVGELRNAVDELLSKAAGYKAFLHDKDWHGIDIGTISEQDTSYLLDFGDWLIITESNEGSSTCILGFEESRLNSVSCEESKL